MTKKGRRVDPRLRRARFLMVGGTVILVVLGGYLLVAMWQYAKGPPPSQLLRDAQDLARVGDDVRAVVFIERARKRTTDPKLTAELDKLYREIVVARKLRVVEGLINSRRYDVAELQLRSILEEQPGNQRAAILLKTVEAARSKGKTPKDDPAPNVKGVFVYPPVFGRARFYSILFLPRRAVTGRSWRQRAAPASEFFSAAVDEHSDSA